MKPPRKKPTAKQQTPAKAAQQQSLTIDQAREALGACLIVLDGAEPAQILKLVDRIQVGKQILRSLVSGQLGMGSPGGAAESPAAQSPVKQP